MTNKHPPDFDTIEIDEDEYPTDASLEIIRTWDKPYRDLFDYIEPAFERFGCFAVSDNNIVKIATGGWSGCEDVMGALMDNRMFWLRCWVSSRRGGGYEFELQEWKGAGADAPDAS